MNNLKTRLKESKICIVDFLPRGAITLLHQKHSLTRQNVVKMLRGEFGKKERLEPLVKDALTLIEEDLATRLENTEILKGLLPKAA